jgi:alkylated DNA repair dioxygenase AlkB
MPPFNGSRTAELAGFVRSARAGYASPVPEPVVSQPSLFGNEEPSPDESFGSIRRVSLEDGAWLEIAPGWLGGHARVFEALARGTRWRSEERKMYDRMVDVPRLYASFPEDGPGHPAIERMRRALERRYATAFERVSLGLYRDGRDSVAFHGDYIARRLPEAVVATVSVGAPRRFLVRPRAGGRSIGYSLGWGDLIVMGGTCQRTYQHGVPKVARAEPRIAIMFRPKWDEPPDAQKMD